MIGRSSLVGKPVSQLLLSRDATVTVCHSKTADLAEHVKKADIVIAAIGRARFVKAEWFKPGAVVLDVGTNPVDDATKKAGYRLVGDCEFEEAKAVSHHSLLNSPASVTICLVNLCPDTALTYLFV